MADSFVSMFSADCGGGFSSLRCCCERGGEAARGGQEDFVLVFYIWGKSMKKIRIGTRKSRLACIQAEMLADYIEGHCKGYRAELVKVVTTGDRILSKRLDEIGQKGLFVKELDAFLMKGQTDLSVHSLKDMPTEIAPELPVIGYSRREDARDVLVLPKGKTAYDYRAPIGCSSNRRRLQLKEIYPDAEVKSIRGNVLTRVVKLEEGE